MAKPKRKYTMTPEAKEQRMIAAHQSAIVRRTEIQDKMATKLDMIMDAIDPAEIEDASFKDKGTVAGIFYDKLYRDQRSLPQTAVQINIQTVGMDPAKVEPLTIDVDPHRSKNVQAKETIPDSTPEPHPGNGGQ